MASTVNSAFSEFLRDSVNLDAAVTATAKASRDWLRGRIHSFPVNDNTFPNLYEEKDVYFGSFERKTKRRPLDDIDLMVCLSADGAHYTTSWTGTVYLREPNQGSPLRDFLFDDGVTINSRRVVNRFKDSLSTVPQYKQADIKRKGEAATLKLTSYDWSFDIVPCFYTNPDSAGKTYYVIPDGDGNWKFTDPTVDRTRVRRLVAARGTIILSVIRLVKFWNCRPTMPTMGSYLLENMILDYYESHDPTTWPDLEFKQVINYIGTAIYGAVNDPKLIQGDLNNLELADRFKISLRCASDHAKCVEARELESAEDHKGAIGKWAEVFGGFFPAFT